MNKLLREKVRFLRSKGKSFLEIKNGLKLNIPKSTLSVWCRGVTLSADSIKNLNDKRVAGLIKARANSLISKENARAAYLLNQKNKNILIASRLDDINSAKLALVMLFLGEGSKTSSSSLVFGNSNPYIISFFLKFLRSCYNIDESKFRCTLQCRADQDIKVLEKFWSKITSIPLNQFYSARVDPRTIGKPSRKLNYKGVCRLDYFSAKVYNELKIIAELIAEKYNFDFGPIV